MTKENETAGAEIVMLPVGRIKPYHGTPFHLYEGERLEDMVESIKTHGILSPVIVQKKGRSYEMLSGHNRLNAAKLAGLAEVPAVVKTGLSEEEAYLYVIETNCLQRSFAEMKPTEQAAVLAEHYEKICGTRRHERILQELEALTGKKRPRFGGQSGHRAKTRDLIAEEYGFSSRTAGRLIRLNQLIPELKKLVDDKRTGIMVGVDLSFLSEEEQRTVWELADRQGLKISPRMAAELRKHTGELTKEKVAEILDALRVKSENAGVRLSLPHTICEKYFKGMDQAAMTAVVEQALAAWFRAEEKKSA